MESKNRHPLAQDPFSRGRVGAEITPEGGDEGSTKWSDLYSSFVWQNHVAPNVNRAFTRLELGREPTADWERPDFDTIRQDMEVRGIDPDAVPPKFFQNLLGESRDQYNWELANLSMQQDTQQMAEEVGGWSALGAEMLSYVSDPVAAAFDFTVGGGVAWGARGKSFVSRFGRAGAYAAATNVAIEAIKASDGSVVDTSEYAMAAIAGFGLGGAFGAMTTRGFAPSAQEQRAMYKFANAIREPDERLGDVPFVGSPTRQDEVPNFSDTVDNYDVDFAGVRFSAFAEAQREGRHPTVRRWGQMGYQDAVRPGNDPAIAERSSMIFGRSDSIDSDALSNIRGELVKDQLGKRRFVPGQSQDPTRQLMTEAGRHVKYGDSKNPLAKRAAAVFTKRFRDLAKLSDHAGLTSGMADRVGNYIPRIMSRQKFNDILSTVKRSWEVDDEGAKDLIADSIANAIRSGRKSAGKLVDEDISRSVARNYVRVISTLGDSDATGRVRMGDLMDTDDLRLTIADLESLIEEGGQGMANLRGDLQRLSESLESLSRQTEGSARGAVDQARMRTSQARQSIDDTGPQGDAERLRDSLGDLADAGEAQKARQARKAARGDEARLEKRLEMDIGAEITLPTGGGLRVGDLFEDNLDELWFSYGRRMAGHIALKERDLSISDLRGDMDRIRKERAALGSADEARRKALDKDLDILEHIEREIFNQSHGGDNLMDKVARTLSQVGFISKMGATGFTAFGEVARPMSMMGVKAMMSNIPSAKQAWTRLRTGKDTDLNRQILMLISGQGQTLSRNLMDTNRIHDGAKVLGGQKFQDILSSLSHWTNTTGLLGPVTDVYRQWTGVSALDSLDRMVSGKKVSGVFKKRYKSEYGGGNTARHKRIEEWLKSSNVSRDEYGSLSNLNLDRMDMDTQEAFQTVLSRVVSQGIQEAQAGNVPRWMDSPVTAAMLQFRSFTIASHERGMLHDIAAKDIGGVTAFFLSSFMASMSLTARHGLATVGAPESREHILTPERIILASIENGVNVGLAPAFLETMYQTATGGGSLFGTMGRSTGMQRGLLPSSRDSFLPGFDYALAAFSAITMPATLAQEGTLTSRQVRDLGTVSLLGNFWYTKAIISAMAEEAPTARELDRHD